MDVRQLATLVAIADHGTFSSAARALYTVQSNVSARIRNLEGTLGVPLFERRYRRVAPTAGGDKLYRHAKKVISSLADAERALLQGENRRDLLAQLKATMTPGELADLQREVQHIHASSALFDYVQALTDHTRRTADYINGLSPRAALALLHAARAWALMAGRGHVVPEDVQAVLPAVVSHRLAASGEVTHANGADVAGNLIKQVATP